MANVAPEAPPSGYREGYVLCSGVRSGLKREFAFALKAQAELLMGPMSRTRSGKVQHSPAPPRAAGAKRRRKSEGDGASVISAASEGSPVVAAPADAALPEAEPGAVAATAVNVDVEPMTDGTDNALLSAVRINGSVVDTSVPMQIESRTAVETPTAGPIEAGAAADVLPPVMGETGIAAEMVQTMQIEAEAVEDAVLSIQAGVTPVAVTHERISIEAEAVEETYPSIQVDARSVVETPMRRIQMETEATAVVDVRPVMETPQASAIEAEAMIDTVLSTHVDVKPVVASPQTIQIEVEAMADTLPSIQVDTRPVVETPQMIHIKAEAMADTVPSVQVDAGPVVEMLHSIQIGDEAITDTVPSIQVDAKPVVEMPQTIQIKAEATSDMFQSIEVDARPVVETPQTIQIKAEAMTDTASSIQVGARPLVEVPAKIGNRIPQKAEENGMAEKPMRRFTRSLLRTAVKEPPPPIVEESPVPMAKESPVASGGSDGLEEIKDSADATNSPDEPLNMTPKMKMELKMSKKIASTKFPSNIRGLLVTGLLDGLTVKYATRGFHKQGLRGVIKDGGILCFCASCKGLQIISAYNFELHAGSKKKHPSDFIYLENGNTLHDVLKACSRAPLDMLESTIQNAISSEGPKSLNHDKCKESSTKSHIGKLSLASDSCLIAKLSPANPNLSQESTSISRHPRSIFSPKSSDSSSKSMLSQKNSRGRMTTKDLRLHKLVFMDDILPDGTEVAYYTRGQRLLEGYIKGSGIFCHCCKKVISPSLFEAHAGWASRRKPYLNIYTSNGVSLHELSISLSKGKKFSASESDDLCGICADGGDLLLCDLCPRAFHKECVGLINIPQEDWYCPCCQNMQLKDKSVGHNENAIAAGRVAGVDPIEQIFKRCIRIAKTPEADVGGCVLCRCHDFSTGFGPRTVLLCDQCEREFHVGCLKEHNMGDLKELPEGKWFCSPDCGQIHVSLQKLVASGLEQLPICQSDIIKTKHEQNDVCKEMNLDVRWRLLSGKTASPETRLLLSAALSIFYESFDPITDFATQKDLIPAMVYGWDLRDQDFGGMHCAVLTVNSSVVSAAILRVLGCEVAELPLVATSRKSQGKGYFQSLFSCIEGMLASLNVRHIVLPAADEAESIWTKRFGFDKMPTDQLPEYMKGYRTMTFRGTSMLHKLVPRSATEG